MGCSSCPKRKLELQSLPEGFPKVQVLQLQEYLHHVIRVTDRTGAKTQGRCVHVWIDDEETGDTIEIGNIAIETPLGTTMIGLNILESVELIN